MFKMMKEIFNELLSMKKVLIGSFAVISSFTALAVSIGYVVGTDGFTRNNGDYLIAAEIFSASFAFCCYIIDRMGIMEKLNPKIKDALYIATAFFFSITLPHSILENTLKLSNQKTLFYISLSSPFIILIMCFWVLFCNFKKYHESTLSANFLRAFLLTSFVSAILFLFFYFLPTN